MPGLFHNSRSTALLMATTMLSTAPAMADQVFLDDLIVDGSLCAGFDCVNGESFSFDTIRLKENNLRIKFQDTSTSAAFPTNDWSIVINDSNNGGDNFFGVRDEDANRMPFRVEAGAPAHSLFVENSGDLGIRNSNPVLDVHVTSADTPGVRLEQNGSSGWSPQTWDLAGNEANFFVRDVTNGSSLPFRIRPGAPSSSLDISSDGDVGIGMSGPQARLHVNGGDGTISLAATNATNQDKNGLYTSPHYDTAEENLLGIRISSRETIGEIRMGGGWGSYNAAQYLRFYTATDNTTLHGDERMRIGPDGDVMIATTTIDPSNIIQVGTDATNGNGAFLTDGGVWTNGSSRLNKIDITSLDPEAASAAVRTLRPVTYRGKQNSDETYVGFIAEEVPDLVAMNNRKGIAAIEIAAVLTAVVQENQKTIRKQREEIQALVERLARLENLVESAQAPKGEVQ